MLSVVKSIVLQGLNGIIIRIEVDVSNGLPSWDIIGLADTSVKESKERVRTAIKNCGIELLSKKYVINLSPANIRKEGSIFDLAIAVGILRAIEKIKESEKIKNIVFIGELSLDAKIKPVNGVLPMCIEAFKNGIHEVVVPKENVQEAICVKGLKAVGVSNLQEVIEYLNNEKDIEKVDVDYIHLFENKEKYFMDFSEVKGQASVKRAIEIAVAGNHNICMIGSPGSGKTMMAKRIVTILPDLNFEEALEITKIYSIVGKNHKKSLVTKRPFRSPHHTISATSMIGGGSVPKPGEISLAHNGVLFLDELPEFSRPSLEALRGPLEDKVVTISRVQANLTYPCNFMLVASMNPCPCGYFGDKDRECKCTKEKIQNYRNRISGPLMDRIDVHIEVPNVKFENINSKKIEETSEQIKIRINNARKIQKDRYINDGIFTNGELSPKLIEKYCKLKSSSINILEKYFEKNKLSARSYSKILKVSRTIADLNNSKEIKDEHILEALRYRLLDKK